MSRNRVGWFKMRTSSQIPSLHALRAFEAVSRLLSFRRAGEELLITQSAISHHIHRLEAELGTALFVRNGRTIAFTPAGEAYYEMVRKAFALIGEGTAKIKAHSVPPCVRVSLLPSFAANWLVPRLDRFHHACADMRLELDPTLRTVDLETGEADVAIRYGDGQWPSGAKNLLALERLTPVLSPDLQERMPVHQPQDLLDHTLLLTFRPLDWKIWSDAVGVDLSRARHLQLTDYNIALQAAMDGQGVVLGRLLLIEDRIRQGTLVAPYTPVVTSSAAGYWLITPQTIAVSEASKAFCRWIWSETACKRDDFSGISQKLNF